MARLKKMNTVITSLNRKINTAIDIDVAKLIKKELEDRLDKQIDGTGKPLPKKKESTKKTYKRYGWNTKQWFIRTGRAAKIKIGKVRNGIKAFPADPDNILQYVDRSKEWLYIDKETRQEILKIILRQIRR